MRIPRLFWELATVRKLLFILLYYFTYFFYLRNFFFCGQSFANKTELWIKVFFIFFVSNNVGNTILKNFLKKSKIDKISKNLRNFSKVIFFSIKSYIKKKVHISNHILLIFSSIYKSFRFFLLQNRIFVCNLQFLSSTTFRKSPSFSILIIQIF